jgi:hypothetical protein
VPVQEFFQTEERHEEVVSQVYFFVDFNTNHFRNWTKKYIDVWPINFLNPGESDAFDTTSLFMMQLACIVNMVPLWSRLKLRLCICDEAKQTCFSLNPNGQSHVEKLQFLLKKIENRRYSVPGAGMEQRDRVPREPHGNLLEEVIEERFPREEMQKRVRSISFSFLPTNNAALSHL